MLVTLTDGLGDAGDRDDGPSNEHGWETFLEIQLQTIIVIYPINAMQTFSKYNQYLLQTSVPNLMSV